MPLRRNPAVEGKKISKPEDKEWKQWFAGLGNKEHEQKLAMLGLDKEDINEWEHHHVFEDLKQELGEGTQLSEKESKRARAKR